MRRLLFRLRAEEALALIFLLPTTYLTVAANVYAREAGVLTDRHPGGLWRLAVAVGALVLLYVLHRRASTARLTIALREMLPFLTCILIYTNLHDTIGFVNPNDVHLYLAGLDKSLFGVSPGVWAERFISRGTTELMSFFYVNFAWIAPIVPIVLLAQQRYGEFRRTTMAVIVCFYTGYLLYVVFPAAPPRLVLVYEYTKSLEGYPRLFSSLESRAFDLLPVDSRAAFPSLHAAVSLVALVCAWRFARPLFYLLIPFVLGLWVSTIYLRHHYVVDLLTGWALAPVALVIAPRLDGWWASRQRALGIPPARGV